ncbi:hypothetical protein BC332_33869 [Capsicum chinense]|nr:hypothetical protein BC332_33869 [Capsicum chinense]
MELRAPSGPFLEVQRHRWEPREELSFLFNSLPTLELARSEVGSSGWKSTARHMVSNALLVALDNPEDRMPSMPNRTHNHIRTPSGTTSGRWNNIGKGSRQNGRITSGKGLALRARHGVPVPNPSAIGDYLSYSRSESGSPYAGQGTDWERFLRGPSPCVE